MRDIVLDALTGAALGLVFVASLFLLDVAEIGTIASKSDQLVTLIAMMVIGIVPFFAACAVAAGVMLLNGPVELDDIDDQRD